MKGLEPFILAKKKPSLGWLWTFLTELVVEAGTAECLSACACFTDFVAI